MLKVPASVLTAVSTENAEFVQSWKKHDPAAIAALFKPDALFLAPAGNYLGRDGVQKYYEMVFTTVHPSADFTHDIDRVEMLSGNLAIAIGH